MNATVVNHAVAGGRRSRLVTFSVTGRRTADGVERWDAADVRLAAEGVEHFGDVYPAGEPFAPLTFTVPRAGTAVGSRGLAGTF
ncbi:HtaA domain-containing protein [Prauserella oleivorans]